MSFGGGPALGEAILALVPSSRPRPKKSPRLRRRQRNAFLDSSSLGQAIHDVLDPKVKNSAVHHHRAPTSAQAIHLEFGAMHRPFPSYVTLAYRSAPRQAADTHSPLPAFEQHIDRSMAERNRRCPSVCLSKLSLPKRQSQHSAAAAAAS